MKIDTKPLNIGKNTMDVVGSWGQIDQADELMIALYSIGTDDDMVKNLKAEREMIKRATAFFKSLFSLSDKQVKTILSKVEAQTLNLYISYVCGLVKGSPYQSFAEFQRSVEEQTEGPKGSTPEE